ncbi:MAG TPA: cupin domain-containing protein, partial [Vicinamibacterales bacterium]|nr:cupin domain-containing protein [Vicinamibacterales bacterium]
GPFFLYGAARSLLALRSEVTMAKWLINAVVAGLVSVVCAVSGSAQQPAAQPGEADPGVRPFRLIDRDEIRVSRVELQPGAVRKVHVHDDVEYHVWAPVAGTFEVTIGSDAPKAAAPGQAFFMKKGTPHGFRNTGSTPGAVFEIFVKKSTTSASVLSEPDVERLVATLTGR